MYLEESIKNIKGKVDKKLKELKLTPEKSLNSEFILNANHYYVTSCFDKNQKKYFFKSSLIDEKECLLNLEKEIYFHEQALNYSPKKTGFIPKYIASGKEGKFIWMLREYAPGKEMGELREINKDILNKKHIPIIFKEVLDTRELIEKIFSPENCPLKISKTTYVYEFYLRKKDELDYDPSYFRKEMKEYETKEINFEKILSFYRKHKKLLANSLTVGVHGDLNPQNLLIASNNKIYIIDWERIHWDIQASEIDFLWASAWDNPEWQSELLKQYFEKVKNKEKFRTLWRLEIMARCWGEAWCWYHRMKSTNNKRVIKKCKRAITTNLDCLYRATQGFKGFI